MTVAELIALLKQHPKDAEVATCFDVDDIMHARSRIPQLAMPLSGEWAYRSESWADAEAEGRSRPTTTVFLGVRPAAPPAPAAIIVNTKID